MKKSGAFAVAMDVDAAGLPFLKKYGSAGRRQIRRGSEGHCRNGRCAVYREGRYDSEGCIEGEGSGSSSHCLYPITADVYRISARQQQKVLPEIVKAVGGSMKIFVDGGIRSGVDIFQGTGTWCRCSYYRPSFCNSCLWRCRRRRESLTLTNWPETGQIRWLCAVPSVCMRLQRIWFDK